MIASVPELTKLELGEFCSTILEINQFQSLRKKWRHRRHHRLSMLEKNLAPLHEVRKVNALYDRQFLDIKNQIKSIRSKFSDKLREIKNKARRRGITMRQMQDADNRVIRIHFSDKSRVVKNIGYAEIVLLATEYESDKEFNQVFLGAK